MLWALVALTLASRVVLLEWNAAEYFDGIEYLSIETLAQTKRLPLYPVLVQLVHVFVPSLVLSGRLTSMLMSTAAVPLLYALTRGLYGARAALYAAALYAAAPVVVRWGIRVMPESTFLFLFLAGLCSSLAWREGGQAWRAATAVALFGAAGLTRPEGVALLPVALVVLGYALYERGGRPAFSLVAAVVPWALQAYWHLEVVRGHGYGHELLELGILKAEATKVLSWAALYPVHLPWIMTPPVFLCAAYGVLRSVRDGGGASRTVFHAFCAYVGATWLLFLSIHWAWTTRLLHPLVVLLLAFAGHGLACLRGIRAQRVAFGLCVVASLVLGAAVLAGSREKHGDAMRAGRFVRDNVPPFAAVAASDPIQTRFWSERRDADVYRRRSIGAGTYVVLQSTFADVNAELAYLRQGFEVRELFRSEVAVRNLLSDETNRLASPAGLFRRERHESVVLELTPAR